MEKSQDRLNIIEKIKLHEKNEWWDKDVEDDPPTKILMPNKVDYLNKKLSSKIATGISNIMATNFFEKLIDNRQLIIKKVVGIENYLNVSDGAILTCNHFNACDNYAVYRAIKPYMGKRRLYKVIREGNYTNFPGLIGFFFRHSNTLPLSSNSETMRNFLNAIKVLLNRGEKILIYPEQAMWWNYKKPRPLKRGAFNLAVKNNAPVIPVFIAMEDSDVIGSDGFPIQEYTIHFLPAIRQDLKLSDKENMIMLADKNYEEWKVCYEKFYNKKLSYKED